MPAATRCVILRIATAVAGLSSIVVGEVLEFRAAFAGQGGPTGIAAFLSVEALPNLDAARPGRAFAGGFFTTEFRLGALARSLDNPAGEDGVLAGLTRDPVDESWAVDWLLQARSENGTARLTDVALGPPNLQLPRGAVVATGIYQGELFFQTAAGEITLTSPPGSVEGFVAVAHPAGRWINAFVVRGTQPSSISTGRDGTIYITGPGILARAYDPQGQALWNTPAPPNVLATRHVTVDLSDPQGRALYVAGEANLRGPDGQLSPGAFVTQLVREDGEVRWTIPVASDGEERAGGLGVGPLGRIRFSFSSNQSRDVLVDGANLRDLPRGDGRHAHLIFLSGQGEFLRDNLLGNALAAGAAMDTSDLDLDPAGNTYVSVTYRGPFGFEGIRYGGDDDAAVVAIDPAGAPIRFTPTSGQALARGHAIAAAGRNLQIMVGGMVRGAGPEQFGDLVFPVDQDEAAYLVSVGPASGQEAYILSSALNESVAEMIQRIIQRGGQVYRSLDLPGENVRLVSAFLTDAQRDDLAQFFERVEDSLLRVDGTVTSANYALEALNLAPATGTPDYEYRYPETCAPSVLYLIDTAIDNTSGYFDGNLNLTLGPSTLVRSVGDPLVSSQFDHGTEMLSMIAGPTYGVAQGTPVTVINFDIYPDGPTARLSSLVEAIALANADRALNYPDAPAVCCVASSATVAGASSPDLISTVEYTVSDAVSTTLIFSAGNTDGLADDYTPSDLGSRAGVVCVGALDSGNLQVPHTRNGSAVDLWAPGDAVAAADTSGLLTNVTGTSASTALATGAALIYLSANPVSNPADLETALVATFGQSNHLGPGPIVHVPTTGAPGFATFGDWAAWTGLPHPPDQAGNDDGDPWTNGEEYIWGLDPLHFDAGPLVSVSTASGNLTFTFPLSCMLYQASALESPHRLRDGSTLHIEGSADLANWTDLTGSVTIMEVGPHGAQMTLSFAASAGASPSFFRVRVDRDQTED